MEETKSLNDPYEEIRKWNVDTSDPEVQREFWEAFFGVQKYQPLMESIYSGLGIPKSVYENAGSVVISDDCGESGD